MTENERRLIHSAFSTLFKSDAAIWGAMFAVDHPLCQNLTMSAVANKIRVTRNAISKNAVDFCNQNELPPSRHMKSEEARESYSKARNQKITK